jgi:hypothetical protein
MDGRIGGTGTPAKARDFNDMLSPQDLARRMLGETCLRERVCPASVRHGASIMNRSKLALSVATAVSAVTFAGERPASACGGCFHPPSQTVTDITDERMLLAVSATQSTLYDQIEYSGSPTSFAWVLPIHGTVTVGLSADVLFDSIDSLTATQIIPPPQNCPSPNCAFNAPQGPGGASLSLAAGAADAGVVQVLTQANVGPYQTVQLHSTDSSALDAWLTQNGYNIPAAVQPILAAYVSEGFDFLAMKLLPDQGVQAMRPVRVTTPGASLSLPLRMASVGTGAITGITIWVVADGRYEPQNFAYFHIDDSQLVWDWSTNLSNYTTLRVQEEANLMNAGWEIESSIGLNEQVITNVIMSGGQYYGNGLASSSPIDATQDYLPVGDPDAGAGDGGGAYESAEQVRDDDITALFAGLTGPTIRVTRIRSDIAQTAMTSDFVLEAAADQSDLSNVRNITQSVNLTCPIYSGCNVVGTGTLAQAQASVGDGGTELDATLAEAEGGAGGGPSVSAPNPGATNGGGGGGCAASAQGGAGSRVGFGALAGILGLLVGRSIRMRRRR